MLFLYLTIWTRNLHRTIEFAVLFLWIPGENKNSYGNSILSFQSFCQFLGVSVSLARHFYLNLRRKWTLKSFVFIVKTKERKTNKKFPLLNTLSDHRITASKCSKFEFKPRAYVTPLEVRTSNFVNGMLDPFAQLFQHCWSHACAKIAVELKFTIKQRCSVRFWRCTHGRKVGGAKAFQIKGVWEVCRPRKKVLNLGSRKCNSLCFSFLANIWQGKCSGYNYCIFPSSIFSHL